jgi:hypothetical protein
MLGGMWRSALPVDDDVMVGMCIALDAEDPGSHPVPSENMRRTLRELRRAPGRGRAVVLELDGRIRGYALLISSGRTNWVGTCARSTNFTWSLSIEDAVTPRA